MTSNDNTCETDCNSQCSVEEQPLKVGETTNDAVSREEGSGHDAKESSEEMNTVGEVVQQAVEKAEKPSSSASGRKSLGKPSPVARHSISSVNPVRHVICNKTSSSEDVTSAHGVHGPSNCRVTSPDDLYLTPTQRKDRCIKELKQCLRDRDQLLTEMGKKIKNLQDKLNARDVAEHATEDVGGVTITEKERCASIDLETEQCKLSAEIEKLQEELGGMKIEVDDRETKLREAESNLETVKKRLREREEYHQEIYLEMYRKGKEAEKFEHEDDVLLSAYVDPHSVKVEELLEQLAIKDGELDKLRRKAREDSYYTHGEHPLTEAEATIEFLKSAVFYYFTDKDPREHLKAILGILEYTDEQRKRVVRSYLIRENK